METIRDFLSIVQKYPKAFERLDIECTPPKEHHPRDYCFRSKDGWVQFSWGWGGPDSIGLKGFVAYLTGRAVEWLAERKAWVYPLGGLWSTAVDNDGWDIILSNDSQTPLEAMLDTIENWSSS